MVGLKQTQAAHKIIMEISLLVMEKSWNNHGIWILNFCGNSDYLNTTLACKVPIDDSIVITQKTECHDITCQGNLKFCQGKNRDFAPFGVWFCCLHY